MAKFKCDLWFLLAVTLCGFCGCATKGSKPSVSNLYELTVNFLNPISQTIQKIQIDVHPGVPFAVRTLDEAGNHYQVSGTLHHKANGTFGFESGNAAMQLAEGGGFSVGLPDFELGKAICWGAISSIILYGESVELNKK